LAFGGDQRIAVWRGYLPRERASWAKEFIPPRPPNTPAGSLNLSPFYNASLIRAPFPGDTELEAELNSLAALPSGVQTWFGSVFDVRGVIQLDSGEMRRRFGGLAPVAVGPIPIGQHFHHLRVIHAAHWPALDGAVIARYRIRYSDGLMATVPVRFGHEIHGAWRRLDEPIPAPSGADVVWRGRNPIASRAGYAVVLYLMTWSNPRPEQPVESMELESTMTDSSVGIVAVTVE